MKTNNKYKRNGEQITRYDAFNLPLLGGVDMQMLRVYRIGKDMAKRVLRNKSNSRQLVIVVDAPVWTIFTGVEEIDDLWYRYNTGDNVLQSLALSELDTPLSIIDEKIKIEDFRDTFPFFPISIRKKLYDNKEMPFVSVIINELMAYSMGTGYYEDYDGEIDFADYGGDMYLWGSPAMIALSKNQLDDNNYRKASRKMVKKNVDFATVTPQEIAHFWMSRK